MSKKSRLPQSRRHIEVYDEDWEWLQQHYGKNSASKLGVGPACREIIHSKVAQLRQRIIELRDQRNESSEIVQSIGEQ